MSLPGVGIVFNPVVPTILREQPWVVDYVEVIPETLWVDEGPGRDDRFRPIPSAVLQVDELAARLPIVVHGISLSIGSASSLDDEHLAQMRDWMRKYGVSRYSEHLGFSRMATPDGQVRHIGLGLPIPCDEDTLCLVADRVRTVMSFVDIPFILENGVRHAPFVDEDMSEPAFMNQLARRTGCGMLLDLHNLYTDCRNHDLSAEPYLDELDLDIVEEIHIAGGNELGGFYTDSHAGACPEEVWALLEGVVPLCRNLKGVTFEFHHSYYPAAFSAEALLAELARAKSILRSACDVP